MTDNMTISARYAVLSLGLALAFATTSAHGQFVAVSNLGNGGSFGTALNTERAISFTTGPGGPWTVASVSLALSGSASGTQVVAGALQTDSGGEPSGINVGGTAFFNETYTGPGTYQFTTPGTMPLDSSQTYWLVFIKTGIGGDVFWNYTGDTSETGLSGWTIGNGQYSLSSGSWQLTGPGFPFKAEVSVVPEPSTYGMLAGLGLVGFAGFHRRRSRA